MAQNVCDLKEAKYVATAVIAHVVWAEDGKRLIKIICEKIELFKEYQSLHGETERAYFVGD